jgi:hypothetical protein
MKYKIYHLKYKGEIIYVGRTTNDLKDRKAKGYHFNLELKKIEKDCKIELIEETNDISRERFWIKNYLEIGYNLLNKKKGDGLDRNSEEFKEYNKNKVKNYYVKNKELISIKMKKKYKEKKGYRTETDIKIT